MAVIFDPSTGTFMSVDPVKSALSKPKITLPVSMDFSKLIKENFKKKNAK